MKVKSLELMLPVHTPETLKTTAKDLGHVRSMTIEPIMALSPTLILASDKDLNPELLSKIKSSGIKADLLQQEFSVEGTKKLIEQVAKAVGNTDFQKLNDKIDADMKQVQSLTKSLKYYSFMQEGTI